MRRFLARINGAATLFLWMLAICMAALMIAEYVSHKL
jgi:hypothetical protein